ncbi:hypothetical protein J7T55_005080 [Diaporthe amygdali]|uniref:uncharacterized protein n=1 Tax=Phomopsis amygdali TaxID=1214568 RepID=UPI0022FEE583|nr:uncharacterized protein J7T55_005080 [Diaporthe amygdali]KAJ0116134.1 hypothetical protein J7T55_005080 [Diaporthe amygdali]
MDKLLYLVPQLCELNIDLGFELASMFGYKHLPTVRTLSVPINQGEPIYEATSIIRACPNIISLRLNVGGGRLQNPKDGMVWSPECRRALEAAAALESLQNLEMFKTGNTRLMDLLDGFVMENGWVPNDMKVIEHYFPGISSLALYGHFGYDVSRFRNTTPLDLTAACGGLTNLNSLTMTTEGMTDWEYMEGQRRNRNLEEMDLEYWRHVTNEDVMGPYVRKASTVCRNLQEISFVYAYAGCTYSAVSTDQESCEVTAEVIKVREFVNSKYALRARRRDGARYQWF